MLSRRNPKLRAAAELKLKGLGVTKGRKSETEEERSERLKRNTEKLHDAGVAEEDALDAMVRRSIKVHGP